jgi:hypothetical protein
VGENYKKSFDTNQSSLQTQLKKEGKVVAGKKN